MRHRPLSYNGLCSWKLPVSIMESGGNLFRKDMPNMLRGATRYIAQISCMYIADMMSKVCIHITKFPPPV